MERHSLLLPKEQASVGGSSHSPSISHDIYRHAMDFIGGDYLAHSYFATEKIDLPRGRVVKEDSLKSSPSHGFRKAERLGSMSPVPMMLEMNDIKLRSAFVDPGAISPNKIARKYLKPIRGTEDAPDYEPSRDYFKQYWHLYLKNENLLSEIDQIATQNYKIARKIFNTKDFYENTLIPQIWTQPHKFLHRLRQ